ncbi:hypothetical protein RJ640_013436 [Escallonia rubra]|uniref:Uncharacterized protein n=1 Tax=Escallonia rubra TaxID=112253 RepID=A0AA88R7A9_9ASTE|nr:hypothetical protein RJ640_013436 [Escallonia rubra]
MEQLPRALGISPVNLFPEMDNASRFFKLPTIDGSGPVNSFRSKKRPIEREEIPITCSGITPVRRLPSKSSLCRFVQLPNSAGIMPSSMFFAAPTTLSPVMLPMDGGIFPEMLIFIIIASSSNLESFPMDSGMLPEIIFSCITRRDKLLRLPISCGMLPDILFDPRFNVSSLDDRFAIEPGNTPPK